MENNFNIDDYLNETVYKNESEMRKFFCENAIIKWHNTNEVFSLEEYLNINCNYPSKWDYILERVEKIDDLIIIVAKIFGVDIEEEHRVVSFLKIANNKITLLEEYWGVIEEKPNYR